MNTNLFLDQIKYAAWSGDDHVNVVVDAHDIVLQIGTACCHHDSYAHVSAQFHANI